jgi:UDP-glucose 4-epimerase
MVRALVTGGAGFIGGYVVERFARRGIEPVVLDLVWPEGLEATPLYYPGDVRDPEAVAAAMEGCSVVVHLAGVLGTDLTMDSPVETVENNLIGTLRVLEEARRQQVRVVLINVGNDWGQPVHHHQAGGGAVRPDVWTGVGASGDGGPGHERLRAEAEGGRDQEAGPDPDLRSPAWPAAPVYGDGEQEVDLVYVEDVAEVLVRAALVPEPFRGQLDAATGQTIRVNQVAQRIRELVNPGVPVAYLPMRRGEPPRSPDRG